MHGDLAVKRMRQRIDALLGEIPLKPFDRSVLPYPLLFGRKAFFQSLFIHDPSGTI